MALARKPSQGKRKGGKKAPARKQEEKKPTYPQRRRSPEEALDDSDAIFDEGTRRDIAGIVFIVLAAVLLVLAVMPADDALVSGPLSAGLHLAFGVGCYILPVVLLFIGIAFLGKFKRQRVPMRAAIGLSVIFVALLGFIALFAPIAVLGKDEPGLLFSEIALVGYGGYIGSGIAWCGVVLLGRVVTGVLLVGLMIVGLTIVGFSVSKLLTMMNKKRLEIEQQLACDSGMFSSSAGFARVRRGSPGQEVPRPPFFGNQPPDPAYDPNLTAAINVEVEGYGGVRPATSHRLSTSSQLENIELEESDVTRRLVPIIHSGMEGYDAPAAEEAADETANPRKRAEGRKALETASLTRPLRPLSKPDGDDSKEDVEEPEVVEKPAKKTSNPRKKKGLALPSGPTPLEGFVLPDMSLLNSSGKGRKKGASDEALKEVAEHLQQVMSEFGIDAEVVAWIAGPTVTLFEVDLPAGVRVSRITALSDDIALALASPGVRIFAPVPGTNYVGIEVPNATRETVLLADVLKDAPEGPLQIAIGKDVEGRSIVSDLAKMPHLLIGGTTGSGKSVAINAMIMSILMRATPAEVRFIMIDPKRVEFTPYNGIPHLYVPVVTEPKEAASALSWGVAEMERRLKVFSKVGARNIAQYNAKAQEQAAERARLAAEGKEAASEDAEDSPEVLEEMPYIVIVIDELADLMMNIGKEVELSISRIAQLARAAGIHLIVATQRPSTNVVTGLIKANITNRIAFNVASGIDSRVILDTPGAESLIGLGDLLLSKPELAKPQRIQGCFVTEEEIMRVVDFVKDQSAPEYHSEILQTNLYSLGDTDPSGGSSTGDRDPLVWDAADIVVSSNMGSTSNIQRRLKVGYARAGRIMDQLEEMGIVGPANGSRPREVLVDEMELETVRSFEMQES